MALRLRRSSSEFFSAGVRHCGEAKKTSEDTSSSTSYGVLPPHTRVLHDKSVHGTTRRRSQCTAAPQQERRSEQDFRTGPRFRKSRRCHPAALIKELRKAREKDSGERFWSIKAMYQDHASRVCI